MSTRIISAAAAVIIAVIALILHNTFVFNIAIGILATTAVFELLRAMKFDKYKLHSYVCYGYTFLYSIMGIFHRHGWLKFINARFLFVLFIITMCALFIKEYESMNHTDFFAMLGVTTVVVYTFDILLNMASWGAMGVFAIVFTLGGAWLADSGAYFAGTFFGKTPLCPHISPKKTVEGLVGGAISNVILLVIISLVYDFVISKDVSLNYFMIIIAAACSAVLGLIGDLSASLIKRQTGIKDYGNIMPGHGGVMDRFDSVILVAPFMYYLFVQGLIIK